MFFLFFSGGVFYNYEITKTCRGRPKIICNGFGFIQKSKYNFRNWVCDKRRERKCMVTSILDRDNGFNITNRRIHTHVPFHANKNTKSSFDLWALSLAQEREQKKWARQRYEGHVTGNYSEEHTSHVPAIEPKEEPVQNQHVENHSYKED